MVEEPKPRDYMSLPENFHENILLQLGKVSDITRLNKAKERQLIENKDFLRQPICDWINLKSHFQFYDLWQELKQTFLLTFDLYELVRDTFIRPFSFYNGSDLEVAFLKKQQIVDYQLIDNVVSRIQPEKGVEYSSQSDTLNEAIAHAVQAKMKVISLNLFHDKKNRMITIMRDIYEAKVHNLTNSGLQKQKT